MTTAEWLAETHSSRFELCRHFFARFFDSDFVTTPGQWKVVAAGVIGLVASLAVLLTPSYYIKYRVLSEFDSPDRFNTAALADHLFFIALSMVFTGMLTAFQWSSLFPGLRDYLALAGLPIRARDIFIAKLAALVLFAGAFIVAINFLPSFTLPAVMAGRYQPNGIGRFFSLLSSTCLAGIFMFFSLVAVQGVLLNILPIRVFARISQFAQGGLFLLFIGLLPFVLTIPGLPGLVVDPPAWLARSPLFWFLALDQNILGSGATLPASPAEAIYGVFIAVCAALLTYLWSYRRHRVRILETQVLPDAGSSILQRTYSGLASYFMREPSEQGVFFFVSVTLGRSTQHRMVLTIFVAAAAAIIVESFLTLFLSRGQGAWAVRSFALRHAAVAAPLALSLFGLAGLRYLFRLPVELRANWLFRINEGGSQSTYQSATDRFMRWWGAFPIALAAMPLEIAVLGPMAGIGATILCLLISLILIEVLLMQFPRVPFTSAYFPAKKPVVLTVLISALWMAIYVSILGIITVLCLEEPNYFLIELGVLLAIWAKLRRGRKEAMSFARIEFDDLPEPDIRTLAIERD